MSILHVKTERLQQCCYSPLLCLVASLVCVTMLVCKLHGNNEQLSSRSFVVPCMKTVLFAKSYKAHRHLPVLKRFINAFIRSRKEHMFQRVVASGKIQRAWRRRVWRTWMDRVVLATAAIEVRKNAAWVSIIVSTAVYTRGRTHEKWDPRVYRLLLAFGTDRRKISATTPKKQRHREAKPWREKHLG